MRLGIFAKTFPGTDPASVLSQVKAAGFATAQYNMACSGLPPMPDEIAPAISAAVAEASRQTGIRLCAVSGTYNMAHPDPAIRARRAAPAGGDCFRLRSDGHQPDHALHRHA